MCVCVCVCAKEEEEEEEEGDYCKDIKENKTKESSFEQGENVRGDTRMWLGNGFARRLRRVGDRSKRRFLSTSLYSWGTGTEGQLGLYFVPGGKGTSFTVPTPQIVSGLNGKNVSQISCGNNHSAVVSSDGSVYTWGKNDYGQLGLGENSDPMVITPERVKGLEGVKIKSVKCGFYHTAALSEDGEVFTWGWGGNWMQGAGALGHGDKNTHHEPHIVEALLDDGLVIDEIECGKAHTVARTDNGELWTWGKGEYGRLGNGGSADQLLPEPVELLMDVGTCTQVACGSSFTLALMDDGSVYSWGRNEQGQLGIGGSMSMDHYAMEDYPVQIEGDLEGKVVTSVAAGFVQALASTEDNELFQWGMGQWLAPRIVLFEDGPQAIVDASCGDRFNVVVTESGDTYTWAKGYFQKGVLGHEDQKTQRFPAKVGGLDSNAIGVSCGQKHTIALVE